MKRIIVVLMLISSFFNLSANKDSTNNYLSIWPDWSVSLSYSPYFAFRSDYAGGLVNPYKNYLKGVSFSIEWKEHDRRFGIASGITYRSKNSNNRTITFLEAPIQLKLYLTKGAQMFHPYIAPALKFCQLKISPDLDPGFSPPSIDYLAIIDLGLGSNIKIYRNIYCVFESNFGYNTTKVLPNRTYLDFKLGLKIKF